MSSGIFACLIIKFPNFLVGQIMSCPCLFSICLNIMIWACNLIFLNHYGSWQNILTNSPLSTSEFKANSTKDFINKFKIKKISDIV